MKKTLIISLITLLLLPFRLDGGALLHAQSEALDANVSIAFETAGEKEYRTVRYALFKTQNKANAVMQQLEQALRLQRGDNGAIQMDAWEKAVTANIN